MQESYLMTSLIWDYDYAGLSIQSSVSIITYDTLKVCGDVIICRDYPLFSYYFVVWGTSGHDPLGSGCVAPNQ